MMKKADLTRLRWLNRWRKRETNGAASSMPYEFDTANSETISGIAHLLKESYNGQSPRIVFSACHAGAGTTSVALAVALAFAKGHTRTVFIEANLRTPVIASYLKLDNTKPGLVEFLHGQASSSEIAQLHPSGKLWVVPAGAVGNDTLVDLLSDGAVNTRFDSLLQSNKYVSVIDTPPMLAHPDACLVAELASEIVLVLESEKTNRSVAMLACEQLTSEGITIRNAVLNRQVYRVPPWLYRLL